MVAVHLCEEDKQRIMGAREQMGTLHAKISRVLQPDGRRLGAAAADDPILSRFKSIEVEVSSIVASLSKLPLSDLWPEHALSKLWEWLEMLSHLDVLNFALDNHEGLFLPIGRWRRLLPGAVAPCFADAWLTKDAPKVLQHIDRQLHLVKAFWAWWSNHLLVAANGGGDPRASSSSTASSSYTAEVVTGENVLLVGNECAVRKLLRWSVDGGNRTPSPRVISFIGPAGVGKTALAMEVYCQLQITCAKDYFQCCATAKMSHKPDMRKLLLHILSQIDKPAAVELLEPSIQRSEIITPEEDPFPELLLLLGQCLQNKRYLIIIDDVWNKSDWDIISDIFPGGNCWGSQIMITTQLRSVANSVCSQFDGLVHDVQRLHQLDSERLFHTKACLKEDFLPDNLTKSRDKILEVCEGIPFLISGMAGWLKEQPISVSYSPEKGFQLLKQFEDTFSVTYDVLPYHLKVLLLYMSMFPRGYMFDKDSLITKWISEQLIVYHEESFDPVEKAEQYFCELVDRNIVTKAANCKETAQVEEACHWQVNYFMLQFLASESANKGFACTSSTLASVAGGSKKVRRLYLYHDETYMVFTSLLEKMDLSHTRSLAVSGTVRQIPFEMFIPLVVLDLEGWQCFKEEEDLPVICRMVLLRYLSLKNTDVSKLPDEIKNLSSLGAFDISYTRISELPSQMSELRLLETLDVRGTPVKQLPELDGLKHLFIGGSEVNHEEIVTELLDKFLDNYQSSCRSVKRCFLKKKKKKFEDISDRILTLGTVDLTGSSAGAGAGVVSSLCHMSSLRSLAITCSFHHCADREFRRALWSCISRVENLKSLTIHCGACCEFLESLSDEDWIPSCNLEKLKVKGGRFSRIPRWLRCHRGLAFIEITVGKFVQDDLASILGNLPTLECLVLGLHFVPENAIVIERGALQVSGDSRSVLVFHG